VIRVLVADDHEFVRDMLVELLEASGDMTVVAQCQDGDEVVTAALQTSPDVVVVDLRMPRLPGLEAARALLAVRPDVRIIVLTGSPSRSTAGEAQAMGAAGYLLKGSPPDQLVEHIRTVAGGGTAWDRSVMPSEMA
jgi:DNA-binding NarL/FixJ family response regulator